MYFVVIDFSQLHTRLRLSSGSHSVDLDRWLNEKGFTQTAEGWYGPADAMNALSCSEIVYSERRPIVRGMRPVTALDA